jgi:hypothetical protein
LILYQRWLWLFKGAYSWFIVVIGNGNFCIGNYRSSIRVVNPLHLKFVLNLKKLKTGNTGILKHRFSPTRYGGKPFTVDFVPKVRLEIVVNDGLVNDDLVDT